MWTWQCVDYLIKEHTTWLYHKGMSRFVRFILKLHSVVNANVEESFREMGNWLGSGKIHYRNLNYPLSKILLPKWHKFILCDWWKNRVDIENSVKEGANRHAHYSNCRPFAITIKKEASTFSLHPQIQSHKSRHHCEIVSIQLKQSLVRHWTFTLTRLSYMFNCNPVSMIRFMEESRKPIKIN